MLELARILELEKSSLTGLIDRAERRDLVQRIAVPGNRRAVRVALTPRGRNLARALTEEATARLIELVGGLSAAQRQRLAQLASSIVFGDAAARAIPL
jgi:DNA-binding MarR family transcriptional regulator